MVIAAGKEENGSLTTDDRAISKNTRSDRRGLVSTGIGYQPEVPKELELKKIFYKGRHALFRKD
ncbi:cyclic lactone autoinducer peptide [bacterium 1XD42-94]|nr:cyclic lactone autoinducer peptide [bacterium 1XD42-76]NBK04550.1 cyclic lactone autoinducer peptide [bacterium 1XD42-94]